jgi:hypothetical protein
LLAEGDREIELAEVVELADAVAGHEGIATGMGTHSYGAQIVVEAETSDQAVERAMTVFTEAADRARLPRWPIVSVESIGAEEEMDWYDEIPDGRGLGDEGRG